MSGIVPRLQRFLDKHRVDYQVIHHRTDYRASATAADTETEPEEFAKTVFLWIDGRFAMAVLPALKHVALSKVRRALDAEDVRLASEREASDLCPDCDVGAAPPFGNLYDLPVYVSASLAEDEKITFNGGSHEDAIRMDFRDFEQLVRPRILKIARHD
jgi:Ala-tRNA(Pro) deacylase